MVLMFSSHLEAEINGLVLHSEVTRRACCLVLLCFGGELRVVFCPPPSHRERWHSRNTCFTLSLSGICYDITLWGSDTLVLLAFSLSMVWNFQLLLTDTAWVSVIDFPFWHACRTSVSSHRFHPFHARWDHVYPLQTSKMLISGLFM